MIKGKRVTWLFCSSYKCQFAVSCNKLKWAANVKFLCIVARRCRNKPHICGYVLWKQESYRSDKEFLALRGRLCSVTSATFLFFPTFSRAILSDLRVRNFQFRCVFRSVIHCSRIEKNNIFEHLHMIREKHLLASSFLPVRLSVCMSAYIRAISTGLIFVEFNIVDLHENLSKTPPIWLKSNKNLGHYMNIYLTL
jgi:hypothetical protein